MIVSTLEEQRYAAPGLANVNNLKGRESPRRWRVSLTAAGLWNPWAPWVLHLLLHPVCQEAPSIQIDLINIGTKKKLPKCRSEFSFFWYRVYFYTHAHSRHRVTKKKADTRHSVCQRFLFTTVEIHLLWQLCLLCKYAFFFVEVKLSYVRTVNFIPSKWPSSGRREFQVQSTLMFLAAITPVLDRKYAPVCPVPFWPYQQNSSTNCLLHSWPLMWEHHLSFWPVY